MMFANQRTPGKFHSPEGISGSEGNGRMMKLLPLHAGPYGMMDKVRISDLMLRRSRDFTDESRSIIVSAGNVLHLYRGRGSNNSYEAQMREALGNLSKAVASYDNRLKDALGQMQVRGEALEAAEQESYQSQHPDPSLPQIRLLFEEEMAVIRGMSHKHNSITGTMRLVAFVLIKLAGNQPDSESQKMGMIEKSLERFDRSVSFMASMEPSKVEILPYVRGTVFAEVEPPAKESKTPQQAETPARAVNERSGSPFRHQLLLAEKSLHWVPDREITARLMREHHALLEKDVHKVSEAMLSLDFESTYKGIDAIIGIIARRVGASHKWMDELAKLEAELGVVWHMRIALETHRTLIRGISHSFRNILGYPYGIADSPEIMYHQGGTEYRQEVFAGFINADKRLKNVMSVLRNADYSNVQFRAYPGGIRVKLEPKK